MKFSSVFTIGSDRHVKSWPACLKVHVVYIALSYYGMARFWVSNSASKFRVASKLA